MRGVLYSDFRDHSLMHPMNWQSTLSDTSTAVLTASDPEIKDNTALTFPCINKRRDPKGYLGYELFAVLSRKIKQGLHSLAFMLFAA